MAWQNDIYQRAQVYLKARSANAGSQNPETQNKTELRRALIDAYINADNEGILNIEELIGLLDENFYNSLLQASPSEVAHHAENLEAVAENQLIEKTRDNYENVINSIPTENVEGLEGILLEIKPQGINPQTGKSSNNDLYSGISEQHFKYNLATNAARNNDISLALNSFHQLTREALDSTHARTPNVLSNLAQRYAQKQGEKYLDMFNNNANKMKEYIARNIDLAGEDKREYYKAVGIRVPNPNHE